MARAVGLLHCSVHFWAQALGLPHRRVRESRLQPVPRGAHCSGAAPQPEPESPGTGQLGGFHCSVNIPLGGCSAGRLCRVSGTGESGTG